jgi:hypothetical protein
VPGAEHRRRRLAPRLPVGHGFGIGAEPPPPGETVSRRKRLLAGAVAGLGRILLGDAGELERIADPPLAIASAQQGGGARRGEGAIVDIAELREPLDQPLDRGFAGAGPAPLDQLAAQIGGELGAGGRIAAGIVEAEPLEACRVERRPGPGLSGGISRAMIVPQSKPIINAYLSRPRERLRA